jgi:hypothetical protein
MVRSLPDAGERLLAQAALLEGAPARAAWHTWRRTGGRIDGVGRPSSRLLPLVYRSLEAAGVEDPDLPVLKGVYRHAFVCHQRLVASVGPALESLSAQGIPTMLLDGAAVGALHGGLRPMDVIDVLVRPEDAGSALAVLRAGGWFAGSRITARRVMRSRHALPLAHAGGGRIDLHRRVLPESLRTDDVWAAAVPATLGSATTLAPERTDQLMRTCAHAVTSGVVALTWIPDAVAILSSTDGHVDWPRFVESVAERGVSLSTARFLELLRDLLGAPIPPHVLAELDRRDPGSHASDSVRSRRRKEAVVDAMQHRSPR